MARTMDWNCWLWPTLIVALAVRLVLVFGVQQIVSQTPGRLCLIAGDAESYWELAGKIAAGEEYSVFNPPRRLLRMPGFPFLLAIPRFLFGDKPFAARILLAIIGTLACGLTYWLGRELAGNTVGLLAAFYTSISPTMALFSVLFLSETAFAAALLGSLIAAAKLLRCGAKKTHDGIGQDCASVNSERSEAESTISSLDPKKAWGASRLAILTGFLIGVATYMRPTWLLVGPGIALTVLVLGQETLRARIVAAALICVSLGFTMAPWTIRNALWTGHLIPTTLWVGPSLYDGLNPTATGDSDMQFFEDDHLNSKMSEYEVDQEYRKRAWDYAAKNPGRALWLAAMKQLRFWSPAPNSDQFNRPIFVVIAWLFYLPLILLSLVGAWSARRDFPLLILTVAPILYFAALHLLFVGSLRYRLPAEYPLAVFAAVGLAQFGRRQAVTTA